VSCFADAAGVAEVPEGQLLEVEFTLTELHRVDTPAPGVTKKILSEPEGSYMKPNDGSSVTIVVTTRSTDGATVYEEQREVTFTTDEEQVRKECFSKCTSRIQKGSSRHAAYMRLRAWSLPRPLYNT
jgi:hypothetical protein